MRPQIRAGLKPGHVIATSGSAKGPWPKRGDVRVGVMLSLRACGARPSTGRAIQSRMALRGKPGDNVEGGSLGGARSPRPHCEALLMPRHFITRGGWPGGRSLMETCLGQTRAILAGVQSPPLRGVGYPS